MIYIWKSCTHFPKYLQMISCQNTRWNITTRNALKKITTNTIQTVLIDSYPKSQSRDLSTETFYAWRKILPNYDPSGLIMKLISAYNGLKIVVIYCSVLGAHIPGIPGWVFPAGYSRMFTPQINNTAGTIIPKSHTLSNHWSRIYTQIHHIPYVFTKWFTFLVWTPAAAHKEHPLTQCTPCCPSGIQTILTTRFQCGWLFCRIKGSTDHGPSSPVSTM